MSDAVDFTDPGLMFSQESVWLWSDGSVFDFSLWHSGEPSNTGGAEDCLEMNYGGKITRAANTLIRRVSSQSWLNTDLFCR